LEWGIIAGAGRRMDKRNILDEIRRTAAANGGVALGVQRFYTETGIKESDWRGRFWARWGDAVLEAGFSPNEFTPRIEDSLIIEKLIDLTREFSRFPTQAEMKLKADR